MSEHAGETEQLEYDPERACPKCQGEDVSTSYQATSHGYDCFVRFRHSTYPEAKRGTDEHFHRHCRRCGYDWREEVIVAGQPTRADLIASYEMKVEDFASETRRLSDVLGVLDGFREWMRSEATDGHGSRREGVQLVLDHYDGKVSEAVRSVLNGGSDVQSEEDA